MAFHLESAGQRLMLTADTANHYVWSLQRPDWEVRFDADKAAAVLDQYFAVTQELLIAAWSAETR